MLLNFFPRPHCSRASRPLARRAAFGARNLASARGEARPRPTRCLQRCFWSKMPWAPAQDAFKFLR
eukprot:1517185-Pyramimonas_sp.AAC.1